MARHPHRRGPRQPVSHQRDRARECDGPNLSSAALAAHGFTLDPDTGEVADLTRYAGAFSARARQIESNIDTYEAAWRSEHPGEEPGPALKQAWDRRAWADARPDSDPLAVPTALAIGRGTLRRMRQNLGWAVGYNAIALPIAAGVFEPAFGLVLRPRSPRCPCPGPAS